MRVAHRYAVTHEGAWERSEQRHVAPVTRLPIAPSARPVASPVQKTLSALIAVTMVFGLVQGVRCGIMSALKLQGLTRQLAAIEQFHTEAQQENTLLNDKLSLYSSPMGMEELAREKLDLVRKDEILVRIYPTAVAQKGND